MLRDFGMEKSRKLRFYRHFIKRPLDFLLALLGLVFLSPVLLITALVIRITMGSPVIFSQERPGKNEKNFKLRKFRTMTNQCDENGNLLSDSQRLNKVGIFLRATSIDELPELWNILCGEMSIIGPRPLLVKYLPYYTEIERKRHLVRPGLSGLAQISGRNNLDWDTRLGYDVHYVENISFLLDLKILYKTAMKVLRREDVAIVDKLTLQDLDVERSKN